jgi:2-polyprenyl-3-methyl-5-hydroxy-6-metoxy-1,4-benzoquinol methylase
MSGRAGAARRRRRFGFGQNWRRFLSVLNDERIAQATASLQETLGVTDLAGRRFLDAGAGSGLFSLAARSLGARVHSFDFDPEAVACVVELRRQHRPNDPDWTIGRGSVLSRDYLRSLGHFDVVYSWGVLHHTGSMWRALENVVAPLAPDGQLVVSIYNDQGLLSVGWRRVKQLYNLLPASVRPLYAVSLMLPFEASRAAHAIVTRRPQRYLQSWFMYHELRGMSRWHDWIDWVGGYPFEVAKPEDIIQFYGQCGLAAIRLRTCGTNLGCNEFVFARRSNRSLPPPAVETGMRRP